jgi:hypothetical protein
MVPLDANGNFSSDRQWTTYDPPVSYQNLINSGKVNPLVGRYLETIPNSELTGNFGKVDLVMDSYGVLSYTGYPDLIGKKLAAVMKPGAELWVGFISQSVASHVVDILVRSEAFELIADEFEKVRFTLRRTSRPWVDPKKLN